MIYMIILIFLSGLSFLVALKKKIKLSEIIIYSFILGLGIHTIIFTALSFINVYYEPLLFIMISSISLILILINKNYKKILSVENDIKWIPIYYIIFAGFILYRLMLITSTTTFNYFNWDELSSYQLVSKMIYNSHDFSSIFKIFTPMNYFWGTMSYEFAGISLVIPRLIMPILFVMISFYIYIETVKNNVNKHIAALLSMIFLVSSAEMIIMAKVFYTNIFFTIYFLIGGYGIVKHYFLDLKDDIPLVEYIILFSLIFVRREGLFLVLGIIVFINLILFMKKRISFKKIAILSIIPIIYKFIEMFVSRQNQGVSTVKESIGIVDMTSKFSTESITSYFQNLFRQTLAYDSYFLNYLIFGILLILMFFVLTEIIKKRKSKILTAALIILIFEFMYIGIVVATQLILFTAAEFVIAASFSRYILMVLPVNFILMGALLFKSNSKGEKINLEKVKSEKLLNPKVLLIIPAYNEEENILRTYNSIIDSNKKNGTNYDVIVINDGSKDSTGFICKSNNIPTINLIHNLGIGGAVQTGYKYALKNNYDIAIQFDGDGQHDIESVKKIIKPLENGLADMVIGSRFVDDSVSEFKSTAARRLGINLISFLIKIVTRTKIYDTTSGFRACNKKVISLFAKSYPTEYPEPITTTELLKRKYIVVESGVKMQDRIGGVSSIGSWKNVYYMVNVILSIIIIGSRRYK